MTYIVGWKRNGYATHKYRNNAGRHGSWLWNRFGKHIVYRNTGPRDATVADSKLYQLRSASGIEFG